MATDKPRKRRDPDKPEPIAKRDRQNDQYHNRTEREMFELGNRATLKALGEPEADTENV